MSRTKPSAKLCPVRHMLFVACQFVAPVHPDVGKVARDPNAKPSTRALDFLVKPDFGEVPMALHGLVGNSKQRGDFLVFQTNEETKLDHFCLGRIVRSQAFERVVHKQKPVFGLAARDFHGLGVDAFEVAAVLLAAAAAGFVHENASHGFGCGGEKMPVVTPLLAV